MDTVRRLVNIVYTIFLSQGLLLCIYPVLNNPILDHVTTELQYDLKNLGVFFWSLELLYCCAK